MLKAAVMLLYCVLSYCVIMENVVAITTTSYITPQQNKSFNTNSSGGFTNGSGGPGGDKMLRYLICVGFITSNKSSGNGSPGTTGATNDSKMTTASSTLVATASTTPAVINFTTLHDLCKRCNISKKECTCEKEPFLCNITNAMYIGNSPTELSCITIIQHVKAAVNTVTGVIGVIGNALVVAVTLKYLRISSSCQLLIGLLAAMDLIFSVAQFIQTLPLFWTCKWIYGFAMCTTILALADLSSMFSLGIILIIALERYQGIIRPLHGGLSTTSIGILLLLNLVFGVVLSIPRLFYLKMTELGECVERLSGQGSIYYSWVLFIFYYLLPFAIISFLYIQIIRSMYSGNVMTGINEKQRRQRIKHNRRILIILICVLVAFATLVFPNRIVWLIVDHVGINNISSSTYNALSLLRFIPYALHVTINPFINSLVDPKFRGKLLTLFPRIKVISRI